MKSGLSPQQTAITRVSNRLRKSMKEDSLIYPDEREGINPFSLMCAECGNISVFYYDIVKRVIITIRDGIMAYDYGRIPVLTKRDRVKMILDRHVNGGLADKKKTNVRWEIGCAVCSSDTIILYGDILYECYMNQCIGCFRCGGAFNRDNIEEYCKQCLHLRTSLMNKEEENTFWATLDMDLHCDACPIQAVREEYGITGGRIKRTVSGKLV